MLEKIKNLFKEKDEKKRIENLVSFLIILVITLIIINKILSSDNAKDSEKNSVDIKLVNQDIKNGIQTDDISLQDINLEERLEKILSRIEGVRKNRSSYYLFRNR